MMPVPVTAAIDTERLLLRLPCEADAEALLDIHRDADVRQSLQVPPEAVNVTMAWRSVAMMIGHWQLRGYGQWTVIERATGETVGRVGLWHPAGWPGVELGWVIRRDRWGQGLATEAAAAALTWAWRHVGTDLIISLIQPGNMRSVRVAEKIGARHEDAIIVGGVSYQRFVVHRTVPT